MTEDPSIKVETPERIRIRYQLAGTGSRAGAVVLDLLIQGVFLILVFVAYFLLMKGYKDQGRFFNALDALFILFLFLIVFFLQWGYFSFFEILMNGRTPGKKILKICVIMENGRSLTPQAVILRNLIRVVDVFPLISYLVGGIVSLADKKGRRLGDIVAGTVVVLDGQGSLQVPDFHVDLTTTVDPAPLLSALDREGRYLNENQLMIIRKYLQKSPTEVFSGRDAMADKLAGIVSEKTGVPHTGYRSLDYLKILYSGHARYGNT